MEEQAESILFESLTKSTILAVEGVRELVKEEFYNQYLEILETLENGDEPETI